MTQSTRQSDKTKQKNMRLNGTIAAIVILLIAIFNNNRSSAQQAFNIRELIQRTFEDLRNVPGQNVEWARDQRDRLNGRLPYDTSSAGQVVDGHGGGLPLSTRSRSYHLPPAAAPTTFTDSQHQKPQPYPYHY